MAYMLNLTASSPLLTYSPDIAGSGSPTAGWTGWLGSTAGYSMYGDTSWIGVSNMQSSAFIPYFSSPASTYTLIYQIDTGPSVSLALSSSGTSISVGTSSSSNDTTHSYTLQVACAVTGACDSSTPFVFEGIAVETSLVPAGSIGYQSTLDDSSDVITYTGFYTTTTNTSDSATATQLVQTSTVAASGDSTLSYTSTENATASVYFTGTAIMITGVTGPNMGTYDLLVDGEAQSSTPYNASSTVEAAQVILGFVTGLLQGEHEFAIQNAEGGLAIDGFVGFGSGGCCFGQGCTPSTASPAPVVPIPGSPALSIAASIVVSQVSTAGVTVVTSAAAGLEKAGPTAGTIVGAILGSLAALALLISLLVYKMHRDKEEKRPEISRWDANNVLAAQDNQYVRVEPETGGLQGYTYPRQVAHTAFD